MQKKTKIRHGFLHGRVKNNVKVIIHTNKYKKIIAEIIFCIIHTFEYNFLMSI